jgi:beta-galactosidase
MALAAMALGQIINAEVLVEWEFPHDQQTNAASVPSSAQSEAVQPASLERVGIQAGYDGSAKFGWSTRGYERERNPDQYIRFTLSPKTGQQVTVRSLEFRYFANLGHEATWELRSSADDFATALAKAPVRSWGKDSQLLKLGEPLVVDNPTEFRIYGYGGPNFFTYGSSESGPDLMLRDDVPSGYEEKQSVAQKKTTKVIEVGSPNLDFEEISEDGTALGWSGSWGQGVSVGSEGDNHFLRFEQQDSQYLTVRNLLRVERDWKKIKLKAAIQADELRLGEKEWMDFRVMLQFKNAAGKNIGGSGPVPRITEVGPWSTQSAYREVPEGAAFLEIVCGFFKANGTGSIDDIVVEVVARHEPIGPPEDAQATEAMKPDWKQAQARATSPVRNKISLNGVWRFMPAENVAVREPTAAGWGFIRVPGSWMTSVWPRSLGAQLIAGKGEMWPTKFPDNFALNRMWFEREITIPAEWAGQRVFLNFAGVGTDAAVFIAGKEVGKVNYPGGRLEITDAVKAGETLSLRVLVVVSGPETVAQMMGYADDGLQVENKIVARGLLDDVSLVTLPKGHHLVRPIIVTSTRKQSLALDAQLNLPLSGSGWNLAVRALGPDGQEVKRFPVESVPAGAKEFHVEWPWENPPLWDTENPQMLTLDIRLQAPDGSTQDGIKEAFGFREFWIDGKDFYLNGQKIRLRPSPHGTPMHIGYREVLETYLDAYKAMGINFVEIWPGGAFDPKNRSQFEYQRLFVQLANEKGMLINGVLPSMVEFLNSSYGNEDYRKTLENHIPMWAVINEPSVVLWGHSGNVFNSAFQPQNIGKKEITTGVMFKNQEQVDFELRRGRELADILREVDPSHRPGFAHHAAAGSDFHTSNLYFLMIPLQEREEWLSYWAEHGERPFMAVEFGEPLADVTFSRGRTGFHGSVASEQLPAEHTASYLGPRAYDLETEAFRDMLVKKFKKDQSYSGWWAPERFLLTHQANSQELAALMTRNVWRAWRTWGLSGGMIAWSIHELGWNPIGGDKTEPLPPFTPDRSGMYASEVSVEWLHPYKAPGKEILPAGEAYTEVVKPTLAWIAGYDAKNDGYGNGFTNKAHHFKSGDAITKQLVFINDSLKEKPYKATWTASLSGQELVSKEVSGNLKPSEILFVPITFETPRTLDAAKEDGQIELAAEIGETRHKDRLTFRTYSPLPDPKPGAVALFDPEGETTQMLRDMGISFENWQPSTKLGQPLLIIGRNALKVNGGFPDGVESFVENGGHCLIMAQDPHWMREHFGFRVSWFLSRQVFPVIREHPALAGLDEVDLRYWSGDASLVEPYPDWRSREDGVWTQYFPYAGWRWGSHGTVTSAAIETPHYGGWTPVLAAEFDMAWSPLLEKRVGQGLLILCMLDLEDNVTVDPAAHRLAVQLLDYAREATPVKALPTYAMGLGPWRPFLDQSGLLYQEIAQLPKPPALVVLGPDADATDAALDAYLIAGGKALVLAREAAEGLGGVRLERAANFPGSLDVPNWPEARGLGPSDLRWRADGEAWLLKEGVEIGADGLLGLRRKGNGVSVYAQMNPMELNADELTYFRYTRWRQTRALNQLLANLGASFAADNWLFHATDAAAINLAGEWQARLVQRHEPPEKFDDRIRENGVSAEALRLVQPDAGNSGWQPVLIPGQWETYGGQWNNADGEAVFRVEIDVPAEWAGQNLELGLGPVQSFDDTYWNGQLIGRTNTETKDWWKHPRSYIVPGEQVRPGRNVLAVRIYNDWANGGMVGSKELLYIRPAGASQLYHPDYRDDFHFGDDPFRYTNW